jgi:uncharacterized protein (DUF58 family)
LWSGLPGEAALDLAIERAAWLIERHTAKGDRVGVAILAARRLGFFPPDKGKAHASKLMEALAFRTTCNTFDRSGLDETDVAARVLEHLRPLEPGLVEHVRPHEIDRVARRAVLAMKRAPFRCAPEPAPSPREQSLRHYLDGFGIDSPPRLEPERTSTHRALSLALKDVMSQRPKPSLVYVCAPVPEAEMKGELLAGVARARSRASVRWVTTPLEAGIDASGGDVQAAVGYAVSLRAQTARWHGERALSTAGVDVEQVRRVRSSKSDAEAARPGADAETS